MPVQYRNIYYKISHGYILAKCEEKRQPIHPHGGRATPLCADKNHLKNLIGPVGGFGEKKIIITQLC